MTDWRELLSADDGYELRPGATADEIAAASNGVLDRPGQSFVIWPLPQVVTRNRQAWPQEGRPAGTLAVTICTAVAPGARTADDAGV